MKVGASLNYYFNKRWFVNIKLSDYNAHMEQYKSDDPQLGSGGINQTFIDMRCHVINLRANLNLLISEREKFTISLLTGPLVQIPIYRKYQATYHTNLYEIIDGGQHEDSPPFHTRLGGTSGVLFIYKLTSKFNLSAAVNFQYARSIVDKTMLWYPSNGPKNHTQFKFYFPFSIHYKL